MMKVFFNFVVLSLLTGLVNCKIVLNSPSSSLSNSVVEIIKDFYSPHGSIFHLVKSIHPSNELFCNDILSSVFKRTDEMNIATQIEDYRNLTRVLKYKRSSVIIVIDSIESFFKFFENFSTERFKFRRYFTIVLIKTLTIDEVQIIFDNMWKRLVKNVNLIMESNDATVNLFTFVPFNENKCGDTSPLIIDTFDDSQQRWRNRIYHPQKTRNMFKCPLIIGCAAGTGEPFAMQRIGADGKVEPYGIEVDLWNEFAKRLNFTPKYKINGTSPGLLFANGTSTRLMNQLMTSKVDASLGFTSLQYLRTVFFSETQSFISMPLALVVPPGKEYGALENFVRPFTLGVWAAVLVVFGFAIIVLTVLTFCSSPAVYRFVLGRHMRNPFYELVAVYLGITQNRLPGRNFARFMLMMYVINCMVVRNIYQGGIFDTLKSKELKPPLASIDEMIDKKFNFYVYETLAGRVQNFKFFNSSIVYNNDDIGFYRDKTLNDSFDGVVFSYLDQLLYLNSLNFKNFTYTICKERFTTSQFVFYFRKSHYLVDQINEQIELMKTHGVMEWIKKTYVDLRFLNSHSDNADQKVLTVRHFSGAFKILAICFGISIATFIVELLTKVKKLKVLKEKLESRMPSK